jgi:hypothetical protein
MPHVSTNRPRIYRRQFSSWPIHARFANFRAFEHIHVHHVQPLLRVDVIFQIYSLMENDRGHTTLCMTGWHKAFRIINGEHLKRRLSVLQPGRVRTLTACLAFVYKRDTNTMCQPQVNNICSYLSIQIERVNEPWMTIVLWNDVGGFHDHVTHHAQDTMVAPRATAVRIKCYK